MAAAKSLTKTAQSSITSGTIIRRVVHVGQHYVCGICRNEHATPGEANGCLTECWTNLLRGPLISWKRRGLRMKAQCRLCKRDHDDIAGANKCANECKSRLSITLYSIDGGAPKTAFVRRRRPTMVAPPVARKRHLEIEETADDTASGKQTATPTVVGSVPVMQAQSASGDTLAEPPPGEGAPEKTAKKPRDNTKKFFRDGARYVCNDCQAKYFTKSEVEKCFDSH